MQIKHNTDETLLLNENILVGNDAYFESYFLSTAISQKEVIMTNSEFVDDKKIKDILTYIKSMKHSEQIRMMFLFSLNGLRAINFTFLQVKDCYTDQLKPNDVINLDSDKNKGKHKCSYFMNSQMKKELADYLKYLQNKWGENLNPETYLFTSQKLNKPYNRVSISR